MGMDLEMDIDMGAAGEREESEGNGDGTGREVTLEDAFGILEGIVGRLESEDITLEESFQAYQQGMKVLKFCNDKIDRVEKKVLRINEDGQTDEF